jgi:hypothetical protein
MSVIADGELQRGQTFECVVGLPKIETRTQCD